jgi:hypothetical protein
MLRVGKEDGATDTGLFVEPDRARNIKGTKLTAKWLNSVQDEICNVIESRFGKGSLQDINNQLQLAVLDMLEYGGRKHEFPIENGKTAVTDLPLTLNSNEYRVATFYSFSQRKSFQQPPLTWVLEHYAAFNRYSKTWTLFTSRLGDFGNTMTQPHTLSIVPTTGVLQYTTSAMNEKEYEGSLTLSHFRLIRAKL